MNVVYISTGIVLLLWFFGNLYRKHKNRNKVIYIDKDGCTGCGRCIKRCTRRVLEMVENDAKIHAAVKCPDKCTACGDCLPKCKFNALKLIERK